MNANKENNNLNCDHYKATLEMDCLSMTPYCACGAMLNEDYFCEKCNKRCRCFRIFCDTSATLDLVQKYIRQSPRFSGFSASLAKAD